VKRDLAALTSREHDLLVIGGGIYGVATAWDAAQRGMAVGLVEAQDFGAGTSWNSLKTIHGGLRDLQRLKLSQVRRSMLERRALLRIAPALVRPLRFVVPVYGHGLRGREAFAFGLWLNDILGYDRNRGLSPEQRIGRTERLSRAQMLALVPGLPDAGLSGGAAWTDAQVHASERLVLAFVHAAHEVGARLVNRTVVTGILLSGQRVTGVRARDLEAGQDLEIHARMVVNAAGPRMDDILALGGIRRPRTPLLHAVNLVLRRAVVSGHALGAKSQGRYLFMLPWHDRTMVGTAYQSADTPLTLEALVRFREEVNSAFPWAGLKPDDVCLVHQGMVPGRGGFEGLANEHKVLDHESGDGVAGLISLLGVKYTTARAVAEEAVDLACARLGRSFPPCRTAVTPLRAARMLEGSLEAQVLTSVRDEMALHLTDVVLRRLTLGVGGPPRDADLDLVVSTMAKELAWSKTRMLEERDSLAGVYEAKAGRDLTFANV